MVLDIRDRPSQLVWQEPAGRRGPDGPRGGIAFEDVDRERIDQDRGGAFGDSYGPSETFL